MLEELEQVEKMRLGEQEGFRSPEHCQPYRGAGISYYVQWEVFEGLQAEVKRSLTHIGSYSTLKTGASLQPVLRRGVAHRGTCLLPCWSWTFILIPGILQAAWIPTWLSLLLSS